MQNDLKQSQITLLLDFEGSNYKFFATVLKKK